MKSRFTKGFTLIELLVVIAIIGILASVVLVSLQSSRKRANDTRVITGVQQLRVLLESGFSISTYPELGTLATRFAPPGVAGSSRDILEDDIIAQQLSGGITNAIYGANAAGAYVANGSILITKSTGSAKGYAIYAKLPSSSNKAFCMDSTGNSKASTNYPTAAAISSDAIAATCL